MIKLIPRVQEGKKVETPRSVPLSKEVLDNISKGEPKPSKTDEESIVSKVLNTPQKALVYGATTISRGIGDGVYATPSEVMKNDWGVNNKYTTTAMNIALDPLNLLPSVKYSKYAIKAYDFNRLRKIYNALRIGSNLYDNASEVKGLIPIKTEDKYTIIKKPE